MSIWNLYNFKKHNLLMESREATQFLHTVKQIRVYSYLSSSVIIFIIIYYFYFHGKPENIYTQEKTWCVAWFMEKRSEQTQRNFQATYRTEPSRPSRLEWHNKVMRTGGLHRQTGSRRETSSVVDMRGIRGLLVCSSQKSLHGCKRKLQIPPSTVHRVELHKYSRLHA
jgi:hypothetical protein